MTDAEKMAAHISGDTYDDAVLSAVWGGMGRDYQAATWALLDDAARTRVKTVRLQTQLKDSA